MAKGAAEVKSRSYSKRFWARRLASSKRLVVVVRSNGLPVSAGGALVGSTFSAVAVPVIEMGMARGFSGRNKSGFGSTAGPVWVERTCSRRVRLAVHACFPDRRLPLIHADQR
jgi:hypothetical protein